MNIIVYTAVFGGYDPIRQSPKRFNKNLRYVYITDRNIKDGMDWEIVKVKRPFKTARRCSRYYKILSHRIFPNADITIWHGGSIQLLTDPLNILKFLKESDIALVSHPERDCAYDEAKTFIRLNKVNKNLARRQVRRMEKAGFPRHYGLVSAYFIVRRHTEKIADLNELWWDLVLNNTNRDQISFPFACWQLGVKYDEIARNWPHYKRYAHPKENWG
jgi:hypothetical protein